MNLAVVGVKEGRPPGGNHTEFLVDGPNKITEKLLTLNGGMKVTEQPSTALDSQYFECKCLDPESFLFDVSESIWPGTKEASGKSAEKA